MEFEEDVLDALSRIPPGLVPSYDLLYKRIAALPPDKQDLVWRTFCWVLGYWGILKEDMLLAAVSVQRQEARNISIGNLLSLCQRLLVLDHETRQVRLAHASVTEYLE
jgi:hypothetical protein